MKIIFVEDRFSLSNPSTSSLVLGVPHLRAAGFEIEVWADSIDEEALTHCEFRRLMNFDPPFAPPILSSVMRHVVGGLRMAWRTVISKFSGESEPTCYVSSGGRFLFADVSIFHFYNKAWWRIQRAGIEWGPEWSWKGARCLWGWLEDSLSLRSPWTRTFLPVSDAIGDEMRRDFPHHSAAIQSLPNAVDPERFSPTLRRERGVELREEFGYDDDDKVLLFVSQGHLPRKGFWLALKALAEVRRDGCGNARPRLVLLGGRPRKLASMTGYLDETHPDWHEWLELVGWTDRVQDYMAAADALFFPSYFEAFSLVEIEAAAVGLPLILTRHHGSEMILEDGVNGYACDFEIDDIKATLNKFFSGGMVIDEPSLGRALTPQQWAQHFVRLAGICGEAKNTDESTNSGFPLAREQATLDGPAD